MIFYNSIKVILLIGIINSAFAAQMDDQRQICYLQQVKDTPLIPKEGGVLIDGHECLDLSKKDLLRKASFATLMAEKKSNKIPLLLAVVTTKQEGTYFHSYYEGIGISNLLFGELWRESRYKKTDKEYEDPISLKPLVGEIRYFTVQDEESIGEKQAAFIGTDYDLLENKDFSIRGIFSRQMGSVYECWQKGKNFEDTEKYDEAEKWHLYASYQGDANAQNNLGTFYFEKKKIAEEAIRWLQHSALQGNAYSQNYLAYIYCIFCDKEKAKCWYEKAAKQGFAVSALRLGELYAEEDNNIFAKKWYEIAVGSDLKGNKASWEVASNAAYGLALLYYEEAEFVQARKWCNTALRLGKKGTIDLLKKIDSAEFKSRKRTLF